MIKPSERESLRRGNIVSRGLDSTKKEHWYQIESIFTDENNFKDKVTFDDGETFVLQELTKIRLNEEILKEWGFTYTKWEANDAPKNQWTGMGTITNGVITFRGVPEDLHLDSYYDTVILTLDELQNIYYYLTKQEIQPI
tara:strand:+ start:177 stop:596 length:420 start_codon:yes stop_codon:yes gene_type:complete